MQTIQIPLPFGATHQTPKRVIVHCMGEYIFGTPDMHAVDLLKSLGLSAHALVTPSGTVIRCRRDDQGAYHAKGHNTDSLGIEILVPGAYDYASFINRIKTAWATDEQLDAAAELIRSWVRAYNITDIQRHSDIDPERKSDPGEGFPWAWFMQQL